MRFGSFKIRFEGVPSRHGLVLKRNFENHAVGWGLFRISISNETNPSRHIPHFDPHLNFKFHVQQLSLKLSRALFQLRRVKNVLSEDALKTLYFSLFHCHLVYAIEIWNVASNSLIDDLFIKQKAAIRIISNAKYNSHTAPLFKKLNILPVRMLIQLHLSKIMFFYKNNMLPAYFENTWLTGMEQNQISGGPFLRYADVYTIQYARTDHLRRFPLHTVPEAWNVLSHDLKNSPSVHSFCSNFRKINILSLPSSPVCTRLYCPVCQVNPL
jgi:hypothetical protein